MPPIDNVPIMGHDAFMRKAKWLTVIMGDSAKKEIQTWPLEVKKDLGSILTKIQKGETVGYPDTKPMKTVAPSCYEIRLKGSDGIYRAFYILKNDLGILVFHSFKKKTQKTSQSEIDTGRIRLKNLLKELENEED
jgi:phage-related protein